MSKKQSDAVETKQAKPAAAAKAQPAAEDRGLMARFAAFKEYLLLSRVELRKVSWPSWKETRATSLVVLGFVAVMAILLGAKSTENTKATQAKNTNTGLIIL